MASWTVGITSTLDLVERLIGGTYIGKSNLASSKDVCFCLQQLNWNVSARDVWTLPLSLFPTHNIITAIMPK